MVTNYVSHQYTRIRRSIRRAIYVGGLVLVLVTVLVAFVLRLGELYWSPIVGLFVVFIVSALHNVLQDMRRSRILPPITLSPEEQSTLRYAQELCENLQLSGRFHPLYITWTDDIYSDEVAFEDGFQKHGLQLPLTLKNKLSPEELRVLIATYLLQRKTGPEKFAVSLVKFLGPLIAYIVVFVYEILVIVNIPYADVAWFIGYAVIAVFTFKLFLADGKKQTLAIDRIAAKVVGYDFFLGVLKKIDDLKLQDMQRLSAKRDLRARVFSFFKPTLQERMDNLTGMQEIGSNEGVLEFMMTFVPEERIMVLNKPAVADKTLLQQGTAQISKRDELKRALMVIARHQRFRLRIFDGNCKLMDNTYSV